MTVFTDTALITATVMGPVLAVQAQKWIERARGRREAQLRIFNTLMATRAARVSPAHVEALNAIDIHFRANGWRVPTAKEREVSRRWRIYADHLSIEVDEKNPAGLTACISSGVEKVEIHRIRIGRCVARMAARWFARAEQACRRARRRKGSAFRRASERQALRAGRP